MKNVLSCIITAAVVLSAAGASAENTIGLGVILGDPSGITGKVFLNRNHAVDMGIGDPVGNGFYLYGDYLLHFPGAIPAPELVLYLGAGAGFHHWERHNKSRADDEENRIEARVPVGLEFMTPKVPVGIFIELVPALRISPDTDFDLRGGIGARYYF